MYIRRPMCVLSLGFLLFLYIATQLLMPIEGIGAVQGFGAVTATSKLCGGTALTVCGTVERKELKNERAVIYLKDVSIAGHFSQNEAGSPEKDIQTCHGFILYLSNSLKEYPQIKLGGRVKAEGKLKKFESAQNDGQFDAKTYYRMKGIEAALTDVKIMGGSAKYYVIQEKLYQIRERTGEIYESFLPAKEAGIMRALVLGDQTSLDTEVKDLYQNAGISHILSLSGLHIATVGLYLMKMLQKCGIPMRVAAILASTVIVAYGIMTGLSTSTLRALIMFLLSIFAACIGRSYDLLSAASVSAILIVLENVTYLYDAAFQLSFGAVVGIGLLCPLLEEMQHSWLKYRAKFYMKKTEIPKMMKKIQKGIVRGAGVSLATQLATMPIVMWNFYQISCYGIIVNLLIIPPMGILLATGILAGFLGNAASYLSPVFSNITNVILYASYLILIAYEKIAKFCGTLPGNLWITGKPAVWQIVIYYVLLFSGLLFYCHHKQTKKCRGILFVKIGISFMIAICVLSVRSSAEFELHALSVGQGDCFLIKGKNTPVIIVDGGSSDEKQVGKYRIIPCLKANAVNRIDYVFLSHLDIDHISGILEILADEDCGIAVGRIILSEAAALSEPEGVDGADTPIMELAALSAQRKIPIYFMEEGEELALKGVQIKCLSPAVSKSDIWRLRDGNENSLVLQMEYVPAGFRALFTGDIGADAERELLARLEPIHYLKVAHHGSRNSSTVEFLEKTSARIAVISAGEGNRYGHPHKETLQRLDDKITYVTFDVGQISLKINNKKVTIATFLN